MDDNQASLKKLATFINSCTDTQLSKFIKNTTIENEQTRTPEEIQELCTALKSVAIFAPEPSSKENRTFSFTFESSGRLTDTLLLLEHSDINPSKIAMIEVGLKTSVCFEITVRNPGTGVKGHLHLKACHMKNFGCKQPFERKFVNLKDTLEILLRFPYHNTVTIYHVEGSNQLSFESDNAKVAGPHNVELLENDPENSGWDFNKDPVSSVHLPGELLSDIVADMVTETGEPRSVLVEMSKSMVVCKLGSDITYRLPDFERPVQGLRHQALFEWVERRTLLLAIDMAKSIKVHITKDPAIMFRFKIWRLGDLWFAKKAIRKRINLTDGLSLK